MLLLLLVGTGGAMVYGPFVGISVYYLFAVLRPQYLWAWALTIDVRWSFYVAAATIISTFIYHSVPRRGKTFAWTHGLVLLFAVWLTLSDLFALNPEVSSRWYGEYLKIFLMFGIGSYVVRELYEVKILYLVAVWSLGYIAYEINILYLLSGRLDIYHLGYGGLDNNGAGLMIAIGVPMAYFLWQGYHNWWRWMFFVMIPVMIHAVMITYSRGAMLSLLVTSSLMVIRSKRKGGLVLAIVCFSLLIPVLAGQEIRSRFFSLETYDVDESAQSRFGSWQAGWSIAKDHPLFGVGIRNADLESYKYGADLVGRAIHSQYLQILADSGFPALLCYILLLLGSWRSLRRVQKRLCYSPAEDNQLAYNLACGMEAALTVFAVGALFLSLEVFELPYLLILLALKLPLVLLQEASNTSTMKATPIYAVQARSLH